ASQRSDRSSDRSRSASRTAPTSTLGSARSSSASRRTACSSGAGSTCSSSPSGRGSVSTRTSGSSFVLIGRRRATERPRASSSRGSKRWWTRLSESEPIAVDEVRAAAERILDEVERAIVGKRDALELILLGLLAGGHVLIEDYPGLAKTLIARSFAQVATMRFQRIQFTPDLMPSDVTGSSIFDQRTARFEFRPGPIFANLLLADEINRAPPKTQAALLEAMQETQVTIEAETHPLQPPFVVIAT